MYFFVIAYAGKDKNGNSKYKVTGFKSSVARNEYISLNKDVMLNFIGGRWNEKTSSVTTQQIPSQIRTRLDEILTNRYNVAFV